MPSLPRVGFTVGSTLRHAVSSSSRLRKRLRSAGIFLRLRCRLYLSHRLP